MRDFSLHRTKTLDAPSVLFILTNINRSSCPE